MINRRLYLFLGRFNSQKVDQLQDDVFRRSHEFGEVDPQNGHVGVVYEKLLAMCEQRSLQSFALIIGSGEPLTAMSVAAVLQRLDGGFDGAIDGDDAQRIADSGVQVLRESTQVWVLAARHRFVAVRFRFSRYDPGLQLLGKLCVAHRWIDSGELHRLFAQLRESNGFTATGRLIATELIAHVNTEVMHDHRDTRGAGPVRTENCEERRVGMVGVLGVVEESRLTPFASADVGFRWQLPDHPTIGHVNRNRFFFNVLALDQCLVPALNDPPKVVVDVMLLMPIAPRQMSIQRFHRRAAANHEGVGSIDVVGAINMLTDFRGRMFSGVEMLTTEVRHSPVFRELAGKLVETLNEAIPEARVVFKDNVRVDSLKETLLKNQQM